MKKILFLFVLAVMPLIAFSQVSTLATYHNMTDIWLRADENDVLLEDRLDSITSGDLVVSAADHVTITDNESTAENNPLVFVEEGDLDGGTLGLETDGTCYYTPSTGAITTTRAVLTTLAIGSADIAEAELEIIDGATVSTDQINYLNAATGTTGTASTNLVFSTSPTLITPALGTPSAIVLDNATGTLGNNLVNTTYPWADNEVANDITASNYLPLADTTDLASVVKILTDTSLYFTVTWGAGNAGDTV